MKVKIIKENKKYQYSFYKIGEVYTITFKFDEYYVGRNEDKYGSHGKAICKTDCEIIENDEENEDEDISERRRDYNQALAFLFMIMVFYNILHFSKESISNTIIFLFIVSPLLIYHTFKHYGNRNN
jgi:hypothetical protein